MEKHTCEFCDQEMMFTQGNQYECLICHRNTVGESILESKQEKSIAVLLSA